MKIQKTMCHHPLKGVVCKGTCFLDEGNSNEFPALKIILIFSDPRFKIVKL
jgi:hypothetical protein